MSSYAIQFLKQLSGINEQNIDQILNTVTNLYELCIMHVPTMVKRALC